MKYNKAKYMVNANNKESSTVQVAYNKTDLYTLIKYLLKDEYTSITIKKL